MRRIERLLPLATATAVTGAVTGAVTAGMVVVRDHLDGAHVALGYLLVVLFVSANAGRAAGIALSIVCFLCFNLFFLPPYYTFAIDNPLDWLVLGAFLATSGVATQLLYRARREAEAAHRRAEEIDQLASLGAETLNAGRAEEALQAIVGVIGATLAVAACEIYLRAEDRFGAPWVVVQTGAVGPAPAAASMSGLIAVVAERGVAVAERRDGTTHVSPLPGEARELEIPESLDVRALAVPLRVRGRTVGVLRISSPEGISLDSPQRRLFGALSYYAALGAERVRLVAEAERSQALQKADRLKDALLASVSHDLRTPLTTIKALAHDIAGEGDDRAVTIEQEADRLNRFVADLLDLSRLGGDAVRLTPEFTAAEDLLGAAIQRVSGSLGRRELRVSIDPVEPVLVGRFDFVHSLRVLVNLVENAHKYSPVDTPIEVTAGREGAWLVFRVIDCGPGVPSRERERIFEPFYRLEEARPAAGGAGLGLSIARKLAELQGGSLAYDTRPGGGSIFLFSVPAVDIDRLEEISL